MSLEDELLAKLNPQQREAVSHHGTPLLIVAGAGSGKTRVITHRIAWLHRAVGIPLWQILAVTFTNKAAREMRERVCRLLGAPDDPSLAIGTFHSRCAMILRREAEEAKLDRSFAILDERDQMSAVKRAMETAEVSEKLVKPSQVQNFINLAKMKMLTPKDCEDEFAGEDVPYVKLYSAYEEVLEKNKSLDFEDLIFRSVRLFQEKPAVLEKWNNKFKYLLVDEFQDTNIGQFELVKLLAGPTRDVCVVGDEDQSIYSWRGADVKNLLQFKDLYPDVHLVRLEQNYRSVGNVLKAAGSVIAKNTMRIGKNLWTEREEGDPIRAIVGFDDTEEAQQVASRVAGLIGSDGASPSEISVFYRSHALARVLEEAMRKYRVPYRIVGGTKFYDRAEIKDLLSYLRLAISPSNDLAFERVVNVPARGIGAKSLGDIVGRAAAERTSAFDAAKAILAEGGFKGKARAGMEEFLAAIDKWHAMGATASVAAMLKQVIEDTRYKEEGVGDAKSLDGRSRLDNIAEFEQGVKSFEEGDKDHTLTHYLETMALDSQREEADARPKVSLMTVHNAKGLEFDHVFVVGLDQGVFPNSRTFDQPEQFEEERRLFYVALTRAKETLTLCRATRRRTGGFYEPTTPSQFLAEIDKDVLGEQTRTTLGIGRGRGMGSGEWGVGSRGSGIGNRGSGYGSAPARPGGLPSWAVPAAKGKTAFNVGDKVRHQIMGVGIITQSGGRPGSERVYVEFEDGRSQEFLTRYAPLTKIEE